MPITETSQNIWEKEILINQRKKYKVIKYLRMAFNHLTAAVEEVDRPSN